MLTIFPEYVEIRISCTYKSEIFPYSIEVMASWNYFEAIISYSLLKFKFNISNVPSSLATQISFNPF